MASRLVLLEELDDAAGLTFLRDQMYVLFQREVLEEEDWGMVLRGWCLEVSEHIRQRDDLIAEMEVIGPRLLNVEALNYLKEIHHQEKEKLDRLSTMLDKSQCLHRKRWYCSKVLTIGL
ncbi:hypothetical protein Tco_0671141 [Tanacetum coccineum]